MIASRMTVALTALSLTAGCFGDSTTLPVNLDFARTNYGYINSGGYQAGSFFAWHPDEGELDKGEMEYLGVIPGFEAPETARRRTATARYSGGVELGGEFEKGIKIAADGWIRRNSSFVIENSTRVAYNNVYTKVAHFLNDDTAQGGSIAEEWGLIDAISDPEARFVIIRDVTFGDAIRLEVEGATEVSGGLEVPLNDKKLSVKLDGKGLEDIRGSNVEVTFLVYVLEPYWKQKDGAQTLAVRRVRNLDEGELSPLFRKVGATL